MQSIKIDKNLTISKESAEIKNIFHGTVPLIFTVMEEKQILATYWPIIKDALVEDTGISDQRVKEGIMVTLSTQCDNSYCFVSHSYFLYDLGFAVETIENMVNELKFPKQVDESEKWSLVLKWSFLFGRPPVGPSNATANSNELIQRLTTIDEYRHLFKICTIIDMLNRFSEFYADRIRIENEEMLLDTSTRLKLPIPDLVKYYEKLSRPEGNVERPVVLMCCYCKNIRDALGKWHALESVLSSLDRNSAFSHGVCPDCYEEVKDEF